MPIGACPTHYIVISDLLSAVSPGWIFTVCSSHHKTAKPDSLLFLPAFQPRPSTLIVSASLDFYQCNIAGQRRGCIGTFRVLQLKLWNCSDAGTSAAKPHETCPRGLRRLACIGHCGSCRPLGIRRADAPYVPVCQV